MPTRILVTGGAGYVGSVLCEHLLSAGHHVTVLDNLAFGQNSLAAFSSDPNFAFARGDARDEPTVRRHVVAADIIIPLAALVGAPACEKEPELATQLNFEACRLLNRLRSPRQLVIYPNTNSGYGTKSGEVFCTEETPLEPISLYGRTKCDAEREFLNSPNTISLRLATVFGMSPRMRLDLLLNSFVWAAHKDRSILIFEKDFKRNFIHVRDVADCYLHCIKHAQEMVGHAFNLGSDSANLSKEELALKIKEQVPDFAIHFSEFGSDPDKRNYVVSNQRLREAGFEAKRTVEEGITELLHGYQAMPYLP